MRLKNTAEKNCKKLFEASIHINIKTVSKNYYIAQDLEYYLRPIRIYLIALVVLLFLLQTDICSIL